MDERHTGRTQGWISDSQAAAFYSTLLFIVMLLWVYRSGLSPLLGSMFSRSKNMPARFRGNSERTLS